MKLVGRGTVNKLMALLYFLQTYLLLRKIEHLIVELCCIMIITTLSLVIEGL